MVVFEGVMMFSFMGFGGEDVSFYLFVRWGLGLVVYFLGGDWYMVGGGG